MFTPKFYLEDNCFYTDNIQATVASSMSAIVVIVKVIVSDYRRSVPSKLASSLMVVYYAWEGELCTLLYRKSNYCTLRFKVNCY